VAAKPLLPPPERWLAEGMKVEISSIRRCSKSPLPRLKSLNYMDCILAKQAAKRSGADEAMFLDTDGNIAETTAWNVFFVDGDVLHTPSARGPLLPGITREIVLELATRAGVTCRDGEYTPLKLSMASEAFLTNSLYGVVPIGQFNGAALGDDMPGPITVELTSLYESARLRGDGI
ncbi:MAG TPA: aminotransferase class IV, partial [Armatimonadota bacterium]|nr:aminotransferase class IV [Armatimonadota bacterium]